MLLATTIWVRVPSTTYCAAISKLLSLLSTLEKHLSLKDGIDSQEEQHMLSTDEVSRRDDVLARCLGTQMSRHTCAEDGSLLCRGLNR